jgi:hypothetical protein
MSQNLSATLTLVALLAIAGEVHAQDNTPSCNPNTGRATARIACLNKMTQALSDKIESLQTQLVQNLKREELSDYVRRSDLDNSLDGYVKYNSTLAISAASEPNASQADKRCIAADSDLESVILDRPCNYEAKPEFKWQLLPGSKTSAENR